MLDSLVVSHVILWLVVLGLVVVILALARQIGILHERVAPMGALMMDRGVEVGQPAPVLELEGLTGEAVRVGGPRAEGKSLLLVFVSPSCPVCKKVLRMVKSFIQAEPELDLVLVSDGDREENQTLVEVEGLERFPFVLSTELGIAYQVGKLPHAVLVDELGVVRAKGLVNSREHLESLVVARETGYASVQEFLESQTEEPQGVAPQG